LDPEIEVGVMRGGVLDHPRYAGRRIFGAGINLTHLYHGRIAYLFYVVRDLGYVNKIYRGLSAPAHRPGEPERTTEKLWVAAADRRALRAGQEPLDVFRAYMATYAREQAYCHFSPALVRNLERHWRAHERAL